MQFQVNSDTAAWRFVDGEAVIIHADTSAYYGLNKTASFIWEALLGNGLPAREISDRVGERFGVDSASIQGEVDAFLATLSAEGLVREATGSNGNGVAAEGPALASAVGDYEPPRLERFGELEQLVLSGE
jgi:hypothetical protein